MTKKAHHHHMAAGPSVNEGMHMSGKSLVIAGEYDRQVAPSQPVAFKTAIH